MINVERVRTPSVLKNNILDRDILVELMKNPIKSNYELWEDYIQHRRDNHDDTNLAESFKQMYIKFWGESLTKDDRKKTEG